ncbi:hypothetical protein [Geothrix sp. 21YS21S-2]|uniref:hypothetical protein n=1 Tax=Geothrix sp. 21YS21S-2 TaxID=3068893 RepID=UPI0027B96D66|nr:hypothetical protein [Geothrix sp. 21YS21S-2]
MKFRPLSHLFLDIGLLSAPFVAFCGDVVVLRPGQKTWGFDVHNGKNDVHFHNSKVHVDEGIDLIARSANIRSRKFYTLAVIFRLEHSNVRKFGVRRVRMNEECFMVMQTDGNLCIYAKNNGFVWNSGSQGRDCSLVLEDNGNLSIKDGNGIRVWMDRRRFDEQSIPSIGDRY